MDKIERRKQSMPILAKLVAICIITCILSQVLSIQSVTRPLMYGTWMLTIGWYVLRHQNSISIPKAASLIGIMVGIILVQRLLLILVLPYVTTLPSLFTQLLIDLGAFLIGHWLAIKGIGEAEWKKLLGIYAMAATIFGIYLWITFFPSFNSWISSKSYEYGSKNSAGQFLAQTIIFLLIIGKQKPEERAGKNKMWKIVRWGCIAISFIVLSLLRCRAALLSLIGCALYYILKTKGLKKLLYVVLVVLVVVLIVFIPSVSALLSGAFFLAKYGADASIDQFSSGRISGIARTIEVFRQYPIFGCGLGMVDCNPLNILVENGIVGAIPYFIIWGKTAITNLRRKDNSRIVILCKLLTIYYLITSMLEGYPPFGPGACTFMLWMLSGYCLQNK